QADGEESTRDESTELALRGQALVDVVPLRVVAAGERHHLRPVDPGHPEVEGAPRGEVLPEQGGLAARTGAGRMAGGAGQGRMGAGWAAGTAAEAERGWAAEPAPVPAPRSAAGGASATAAGAAGEPDPVSPVRSPLAPLPAGGSTASNTKVR